MNLQTEITSLRRRVYDLARSDVSDSTFSDEELVEMVYFGECELARDLNYQALQTLSNQEFEFTTVTGQQNYSLSGVTRYMRPLGIQYSPNGVTLRPCRMLQPEDFTDIQNDPAFRATNYAAPYATISTGQIFVYPSPNPGTLAGLKVRYVRRPVRRTLFFRFQATVAGAASIESGNVGSKANGQATDAWIASRMMCALGALAGEEYAVTSSSPTNGVFGFPAAPNRWSSGTGVLPGDTFEVGQVSEIDEQWLYIAHKYAVYLAMTKIRMDGEAQRAFADYQSSIQSVNKAFGEPPVATSPLGAVTQ